MDVHPFDGLVPAADTSGIAWALPSMRVPDLTVGQFVPDGFPAYVRIHFRASGEAAPTTIDEGVQDGGYEIEASVLDALSGVLTAATTTPTRCHFGLWMGWGGLTPGSSVTTYARAIGDPDGHAEVDALRRRSEAAEVAVHAFVGSCPIQPWWGGRDTVLFDGPLDRVDRITTAVNRLVPQWWWPEDRAWFVAREIDFEWLYVAGSAELIDQVIVSDDFVTVRVGRTEPW